MNAIAIPTAWLVWTVASVREASDTSAKCPTASPENDVSGTVFYGSAEEIGNYDEEDGGKNEVQVAEFLTEGGAALVEMRFCCGEIRANAGGQCALEPRDLRRAWGAEIVGDSVPCR